MKIARTVSVASSASCTARLSNAWGTYSVEVPTARKKRRPARVSKSFDVMGRSAGSSILLVVIAKLWPREPQTAMRGEDFSVLRLLGRRQFGRKPGSRQYQILMRELWVFYAAKSVIYLLCGLPTVCYSACQVPDPSCKRAAKKTSRVPISVDDCLLPQCGVAAAHHLVGGWDSDVLRFPLPDPSGHRQDVFADGFDPEQDPQIGTGRKPGQRLAP